VQNLLLAARALGYGGVITGFHGPREAQLRELLHLPPPESLAIAATIPLGPPARQPRPVRRRPIAELVYDDAWEAPRRGRAIRPARASLEPAPRRLIRESDAATTLAVPALSAFGAPARQALGHLELATTVAEPTRASQQLPLGHVQDLHLVEQRRLFRADHVHRDLGVINVPLGGRPR
jgi:hypothetical protein